jgi:hypothetical protein
VAGFDSRKRNNDQLGGPPASPVSYERLPIFKGKGERRAVVGLGPMGDKVAGDWRQMHKEELHNLYCSSNIWKLILKTVSRDT